MRFVLLGNAASPRIEGFQAALARFDLPPAILVEWADFLRGHVGLSEVVQTGDIVRLESPGRDWPVEKLLLQRGAGLAEAEGAFEWIPPEFIEDLAFEKGRLWPSRQWFLGLKSALAEIENQLGNSPGHRASHAPRDIEIMFDKPRCQALFESAALPVPRNLGTPQNFEELQSRMKNAHCRRVFVKLAHGSSAAGVVAYETNGAKHRAVTTTEVVQEKGRVRLYNSRRVQVLQSPEEIASLIDALCRQRAHAEAWIPKANFQGQSCDLRVVTIAGRARHKVVRLSRHPLTNLHLLNARADAEELRQKVLPESWQSAIESCEKAANCFAPSLCCGVDLLFTPGFGRHAILEANAWGDLLPGAVHEGDDTYAAQIRAMNYES